MRRIIAALQVSVDGFIEGPKGELDWAMAEDGEAWADVFEHAQTEGWQPPLDRALMANDEVYAAGLLNRALDRHAAAPDPGLLARRARPASRGDHRRHEGD